MENSNDNPRDGEFCAFCDHPAAAAWRGQRLIAVCPSCAIEVLPKLAADAIDLAAASEADRLKWIVMQMKSKFWKALSLRLVKERKR